MEDSLVKSISAVISKDSGFVDSRGSDDGCVKGKSVGVNDGGKKVKKRKRSKNVGSGGDDTMVKKSRSSVENGGSGLGLNGGGGLSGFSVGLDGSGDFVRVPRKKRGSVGSKTHVGKQSGSCSSVDQSGQIKSDLKVGNGVLVNVPLHAKKKRGKLNVDKGKSVDQTEVVESDLKDCKSDVLCIPQHAKKKRGQLVVGKGKSVDQTEVVESDLKECETDVPSKDQHAEKKTKQLISDEGNSGDQIAKLESDLKDGKTAKPRIPKHGKKRREPLVVDKGSSVDQTPDLNSDKKDRTTAIPRLPQHVKKRKEPLNVDKGSLVDQTDNSNCDRKDTTISKPKVLEVDEKRIEQLVTDKEDLIDRTAMLKSDLKDRMAPPPSTPQHAKKRRKKLIADEGKVNDASFKKEQSHGKKRKGLPLDSLESAEKAQPAVGHRENISEDSMDDEENLEKNAAMMLSSRFDPRCTGPSSKSKSSPSHSGGDTGSHTENLQASSECPSPDNGSRSLRPRYNHKEKGCPRKRRHFYEVGYVDKDPRWFLNKRIKVFWPLDERWYHGLVNDYDEERKLHHVKYDDKDKEWINLRNERFMLLLLRSEVTDVKKPPQSCTEDKMTDETRKKLSMSETDANSRNHLESEPIISWLARSNRAKSLAGVKKQKTFHPSPSDSSPSSRNVTNAHRNSNVCSLEKDTSGIRYSDSVDRLAVEADGGEVMSKHRSSIKENGLRTVYFRRRFRKNKDASISMPVDNNVQSSLPTEEGLPTVADRFSTSDKENVLLDCIDPSNLMLLIGSDGMSKLNLALLAFKKFVTHVSLPVRCLLDFPFGSETSRYFRLSLLQQYGTIVSTWPTVYLETLFVDNEVGLRFFVLEGCLQQAVAFVFVVLNMFFDAKKQSEPVDLQIPVASIRFKLSCTRDLRKQHIFSFYSFSKMKHSNWLHLDSISQKQCFFTKKLPLTECTLGNIQAFESASKQIHINSVSWQSSFQGTRRKCFQDIIPIGLSKPGKENWSPPPNCNVMPGILPLAISFSAAPLLFRSLHLKLLMKSSIACFRLRECTLACSLDSGENTSKSTTIDCAVAKHGSEIFSPMVPESTPDISLSNEQLETPSLTANMNCGRIMSSLHNEDKSSDAAKTYTCSSDGGSIRTDVIAHSLNRESHNPEPERLLTLKNSMSCKGHDSAVISGESDSHNLKSMSVEIPEIHSTKSTVLGKSPCVRRIADYISTTSDGIIKSPNTVSSKSFWTADTRNLSSSPLAEISPVWHGEKTNVVHSGFGNGPRKPRTQVHYAMPFAGSDFSPRHKPLNQNGLPFRRVRRASEKRTSDDSKGSQRNLELLACDSNVLITLGDRCWREFGARVTLEFADQNEWRLAVKFSGSTRYSHKVLHVFQPGSTNRYTHAMMWKGGKDWALEFPDRGQWMLFKEMHEECYNRNIRAASVKNIPIPGVHLVEENDAITEKYPFMRSPRYFRQIEDDIDMALNPSKILYDMDSEDEEWIVRNENSFQTQETCHVAITDDLFEKTMDTLEKVAYAQRRDHFTVAEIEKLMGGVVPSEVYNAIYQHWQQKRKKTGCPLIRHLQPPSWERYQQKLQEWNQIMSKANTATAGKVKKPPPAEKPAMFAFCLKPRGLEVPNKGSKHRSQKKIHANHALIGDQDGVHTFGRRSNSFAFRDEKATYADYSPENSDTSPSRRTYSPSDVCSHEYFSLNNDTSDFDNHPKLYKNKSKKIGALMPRSNVHALPSYNQRTPGKRNGVQRRDVELPCRPIQMHYQSEVYPGPGNMQLGVRDLDEFGVREASSAAKRTSIIAVLKREKAQRLLYRADLAINVAASAIMAADALKASYCANEDKNASSSE
ncbi:Tudor domain-containing protein [Heracleum sosnowskyi]|uniref:Enhancer of polycomb-like protein n=1 Tax=Heracleum sosnowskyi TaxID=360622 RepID=A0AAD8HMY3_9APIA|nr:Tudor domain-containing protein [Heracleum sosnowskyi]